MEDIMYAIVTGALGGMDRPYFLPNAFAVALSIERSNLTLATTVGLISVTQTAVLGVGILQVFSMTDIYRLKYSGVYTPLSGIPQRSHFPPTNL